MSTTEPVCPTGIGNPAMRALRAAGYTCLDDLAGVPAAELASLHGVGPKAVRIVQEALERTGRSLS
ncbi:helix-hairpin-helix domain-containing protein [Rhodococcoides fascians]